MSYPTRRVVNGIQVVVPLDKYSHRLCGAKKHSRLFEKKLLQPRNLSRCGQPLAQGFVRAAVITAGATGAAVPAVEP